MTSQDYTTFAVGPGVEAAMAEFDDEPRSDEMTIVGEDGHRITQTYGKLAVYIYIQEDNRTNRLPF